MRKASRNVWGDTLAGKVTAQAGDLAALQAVQDECNVYPERWRADILDAIDPEIRRAEGENLETLNITLLFERFVSAHFFAIARPRPLPCVLSPLIR